MITNSKLTVYHRSINYETKLEEWIRYNYNEAWTFGGKGAGIDRGYDNANDIQVRIPYEKNDTLNINDFSIGDILVPQELDVDITAQADLDNYEFYNITSIKDNNFGHTPHIHLGGK